jgi:hypothetical protein
MKWQHTMQHNSEFRILILVCLFSFIPIYKRKFYIYIYIILRLIYIYILIIRYFILLTFHVVFSAYSILLFYFIHTIRESCVSSFWGKRIVETMWKKSVFQSLE